MAVTQYIGSRYVPLFADPIDWDITRGYEPLTIVYYQGNSYTSKQAVPTGIDVTNTTYWAITGNYNAQIEQYRREVQAFDGRITANAQAIADEVTARMQEDTAIRALITTLNTDLESEESAREAADTQIRTDFAAADTQIRADFAAADTQIRADFAAADTQIRTDFTAADTALSLKSSRMLVFGDSWIAHASSVPVDNCWIYNVAKGLGNLEIDCYAKAGAKISTSDANRDSLLSQVQDAISAIPSGNRNRFEYAFIMGGVNDFNDSGISASSFRSGLQNAINLLSDAFPNTKIVLIPLNLFYGRYNNNARYNDFSNAVYLATRGRRIVTFYDLAGTFRLFGQSVYRPNNDSSYTEGGGTYHPNNVGNNLIANYILQGILTGSTFNVPVNFTALNGFTILANQTNSDGKFIYWNMKVKTPATQLSAGYNYIGRAKWDNYDMVLSDTYLDTSGNNPFAQAIPLANSGSVGACTMFVKDVDSYDTTDATKGQLLMFNEAAIPANQNIIISGISKIM